MSAPPVIPETARIGRTALRVTDLEEVIEFYRDVVGLTVLAKTRATATLGAGASPLLVLQRDEGVPPRGSDRAGLFHNAFRVPTRTALGAALDRIRDSWQLSGASDHHVSEALYLTDPEGNGVEIYADRPRSEWPRRGDGTVEIGTVPLGLDEIAARSDGTADAPPGTTVGHVHLETSSLEAARGFYVGLLGLTVQTEMPSALFLAAGDYHHHLGVNDWNARSKPAGGRGLAWYEFVVPDEDALQSVRERLASVDDAVTERAESLELTDPDGIEIRVRAA